MEQLNMSSAVVSNEDIKLNLTPRNSVGEIKSYH